LLVIRGFPSLSGVGWLLDSALRRGVGGSVDLERVEVDVLLDGVVVSEICRIRPKICVAVLPEEIALVTHRTCAHLIVLLKHIIVVAGLP